jgi:hypothetical protein
MAPVPDDIEIFVRGIDRILADATRDVADGKELNELQLATLKLHESITSFSTTDADLAEYARLYALAVLDRMRKY